MQAGAKTKSKLQAGKFPARGLSLPTTEGKKQDRQPTNSGHGTLGGRPEIYVSAWHQSRQQNEMKQSLPHIEAELVRKATVVGVRELIRPLLVEFTTFTRYMARSQRAARQMKLPHEFHQNGCGMWLFEARLRREKTLPWMSLPMGSLTLEDSDCCLARRSRHRTKVPKSSMAAILLWGSPSLNAQGNCSWVTWKWNHQTWAFSGGLKSPIQPPTKDLEKAS